MSECLTHFHNFHSDNDEDDDSQARLPLEAIVLVNIMAPLAMKPTSFHALFCNSDQRFYLHHLIIVLFSLILILHNEKFYKEDKSKILLLLATLISIVVPCIYSIVIMMWII